MNNSLDKLLTELEGFLEKEGLELELVVIGAYALYLQGVINRLTVDIDTVTSISNQIILKKIQEIGESYGIYSWLNDQAETVTLPEGFFSRLKNFEKYKNIKLKVASRIDLICLKVAAYFYRGEFDPKDLDDLKALKPSLSELMEGLTFLHKSHRPDVAKFQKDFEIEFQNFKKGLLNDFSR